MVRTKGECLKETGSLTVYAKIVKCKREFKITFFWIFAHLTW